MTIDIFQYSNMYTLRKSIQWLADEVNVREECGPYVTKPGAPKSLCHQYGSDNRNYSFEPNCRTTHPRLAQTSAFIFSVEVWEDSIRLDGGVRSSQPRYRRPALHKLWCHQSTFSGSLHTDNHIYHSPRASFGESTAGPFSSLQTPPTLTPNPWTPLPPPDNASTASPEPPIASPILTPSTHPHLRPLNQNPIVSSVAGPHRPHPSFHLSVPTSRQALPPPPRIQPQPPPLPSSVVYVEKVPLKKSWNMSGAGICRNPALLHPLLLVRARLGSTTLRTKQRHKKTQPKPDPPKAAADGSPSSSHQIRRPLPISQRRLCCQPDDGFRDPLRL